MTVSDSGTLIEFYLSDGALVDSYFVDAPAGGNPLFVNGHDVLNGTIGDDYLWGLYGNDTLSGFAGDDTLIGGDGDDLFVFAPGTNNDEISDFSPGQGTVDRIDLTAFGLSGFNEVSSRAMDIGADVVIDLDNGDDITIVGLQEAQLHQDDFLL